MAVGNACHISEATAFHISSQSHTARRHMELIAYWCAGFLHAHHELSASWRLELMSNCVRILGGFCSRVIGSLCRSLRDKDGSVFSQTSIIRRLRTEGLPYAGRISSTEPRPPCLTLPVSRTRGGTAHVCERQTSSRSYRARPEPLSWNSGGEKLDLRG
ncbi:hypothetical protein AOLI_G00306520 [Acnodon oligacanthus]